MIETAAVRSTRGRWRWRTGSSWTDWAREARFKIPVAVTQGVWGVLKPSKELETEGEDVAGRAWDMFTILLHAIRGAAGGDEVHFVPLFTQEPGRAALGVEMWAKCGPGDNAEPYKLISSSDAEGGVTCFCLNQVAWSRAERPLSGVRFR